MPVEEFLTRYSYDVGVYGTSCRVSVRPSVCLYVTDVHGGP